MAAKTILTAARLREVRFYEPHTGLFYKFKKMRSRYEVTGSPHIRGYVRITVDWGEYLAHRLAWLYMTGEWPASDVDHINGDKADNRWSNLRLVSASQNLANRDIMRTNTNGHTGTYFNRKTDRWQAQFRNKFIASFATQQEAGEAYAAAAREHYGEFAHERFRPSARQRHTDSRSLAGSQPTLQRATQPPSTAPLQLRLPFFAAEEGTETPRSKRLHQSKGKV